MIQKHPVVSEEFNVCTELTLNTIISVAEVLQAVATVHFDSIINVLGILETVTLDDADAIQNGFVPLLHIIDQQGYAHQKTPTNWTL